MACPSVGRLGTPSGMATTQVVLGLRADLGLALSPASPCGRMLELSQPAAHEMQRRGATGSAPDAERQPPSEIRSAWCCRLRGIEGAPTWRQTARRAEESTAARVLAAGGGRRQRTTAQYRRQGLAAGAAGQEGPEGRTAAFSPVAVLAGHEASSSASAMRRRQRANRDTERLRQVEPIPVTTRGANAARGVAPGGAGGAPAAQAGTGAGHRRPRTAQDSRRRPRRATAACQGPGGGPKERPGAPGARQPPRGGRQTRLRRPEKPPTAPRGHREARHRAGAASRPPDRPGGRSTSTRTCRLQLPASVVPILIKYPLRGPWIGTTVPPAKPTMRLHRPALPAPLAGASRGGPWSAWTAPHGPDPRDG